MTNTTAAPTTIIAVINLCLLFMGQACFAGWLWLFVDANSFARRFVQTPVVGPSGDPCPFLQPAVGADAVLSLPRILHALFMRHGVSLIGLTVFVDNLSEPAPGRTSFL